MTLACAYTPISRCHASYMCTCVSRCSVWIDHSVLTGRSDLSVERNRVDSITTSNEFDTPFYYEDVAICWAFSLDSRSFSLSPFPHCPSSSRSRSLFHSLGPSYCWFSSPHHDTWRSLSPRLFSLSFSDCSLSGSLSWTGSCNEQLRRQTRRLVSHRGEWWRYFGNITAGYPGR